MFFPFFGFQSYGSRKGDKISNRDEEHRVPNPQSASILPGDFVAMGDERKLEGESASEMTPDTKKQFNYSKNIKTENGNLDLSPRKIGNLQKNRLKFDTITSVDRPVVK